MATTKIQKEYLDDELVEVLTATDTSTATPTPTGNAKRNFYTLTALATNATFGAPSGTPANGNVLLIRYLDNSSIWTLGYNAIYRAVGVTLPTATVAGKTGYMIAIYNSAATKWDIIQAVVQA